MESKQRQIIYILNVCQRLRFYLVYFVTKYRKLSDYLLEITE